MPDRHGTGTNALLLTPPDVIEPSFGEGSRARHERLAQRGRARPSASPRSPSLMLDVDTPEDLDALAEALADSPRGDRRLHARRAQPRARGG